MGHALGDVEDVTRLERIVARLGDMQPVPAPHIDQLAELMRVQVERSVTKVMIHRQGEARIGEEFLEFEGAQHRGTSAPIG